MYDVSTRALDVAGALAILLVTLPVLALATLAIRATMGGPVLFRQRRAGKDGSIFVLLKLRTMRADDAPAGGSRGATGLGTTDATRLTPLGRRLRDASIDELPQLWNVLRGDMSLVGPRPLLPEYLPRYSPFQARRHTVRPGITGLAQVSGRNALSWDEKFTLDVTYTERRSLRLDCWILWRTLMGLLHREGITAPGSATMPEFMGAHPGGKGDVCVIS